MININTTTAKKLKQAIEKWIKNNGACDINIKDEEILLYNGGHFEDMDEDKAQLWIGDLDNFIRYLRRLQSFLKKQGFNTRRDINDAFIDKVRKSKSKVRNR